jgi:hypothetical protein
VSTPRTRAPRLGGEETGWLALAPGGRPNEPDDDSRVEYPYELEPFGGSEVTAGAGGSDVTAGAGGAEVGGATWRD